MSTFDVDATDFDPAGGPGLPGEGIYHVEVKTVSTKPSKSGDKMLTLELAQVSNKKTLVFERLTFGEKALSLSIAKLIELGVAIGPDKRISFDPVTLIGRRCAVLIVHSDGTDQYGKPKKEARVGAFGAVKDAVTREPGAAHVKWCGYLSEKAAIAANVIGEAPATVDNGTPF